MEERLPRKLAAILYADVAGYSRLTGEDEDATHRVLREYLELITSTVESRRGQVMHFAGDAVLAQFSAVVDAVSAALAIQTVLQGRNEMLADDRKVEFRIGVNLGDVIEDRGDIYGDGVNVAARLEALSEPGGVCISDAIRTAIGSNLPYEFVFIGEHSVKNIKEPVRAYRVLEQGSTSNASIPSLPSAKMSHPSFGKPSIAVKPFAPMGRDEEQQQLADGLTNGISVALTRLPGLIFINDESPSLVESKRLTIQELAARLNVRYVLKGNIQKFGNKIRVSAELIEVSTSQVQWAGQFDRTLKDLGDFFAIQDDITEEIVTALDVKLLSGEAARLVRRAFKDPTALEYYFRGEDLLWRATMRLEFREAERLFEETIRLQPDSPVGYAAAALTYWVEVISGLSDSPDRALDQAVERAHEAIDRNDVTGYAHLVLAHVHLQKRNFDDAMTEATRAVLDRPSCPAAYALKAAVLTYTGRPDEAIEFAQYATRLTPVHPPMIPAILASALYGSGRYEEAAAAAQAAIELRETDVDPYLVLAASKTAKGSPEEARLAAEKVLELNPDFSLAKFSKSQPYKKRKQLSQLLDHLRGAGFK
jgi:class 3 adenylate cyclase/tetratricopeptide (TPR) repeat protein